MAYELGNPVKYVNAFLGFQHEGPFDSVATALATILPALRVKGMSCVINEVGQPAKIYWFRDGTTNLVEFSVSGANLFRGEYASVGALPLTGNTLGNYAMVVTLGVDGVTYFWDNTNNKWVSGGGSTPPPPTSDYVEGDYVEGDYVL